MGDTFELPEMQEPTFSIVPSEGADMLFEQVGREVQGLLGSNVVTDFGHITIGVDDASLAVGL